MSPMVKELIVFDLDGTLAESKLSIDPEMAGLLGALLEVLRVAVISGGDWPQFERQLLPALPRTAPLTDLSLLPTCGAKFYEYDASWTLRYSEDFTADERRKIMASLEQVIQGSDFIAGATWGEQIEDRGSQITLSALGQQAPIETKKLWDPDFFKRKRAKAFLETVIPEFTVRLGGTTSVDITRQGVDKAYGLNKLREILGINIPQMIFVGDALFPGGNDYPAKELGVATIQVRDPDECKRVIEAIVGCVEPTASSTRCGHCDE